MSFSFEQEINGKLLFLNAEVYRNQGKFVTKVYRKPTLVACIPICLSFANGMQSWYDVHSTSTMF